MGIKAVDLTPFNISTISPPAKCVLLKTFQILRTDTTATVKAQLPAAATVVDIQIVGALSNAGTTATVSVGTTSTANEWINAQDVKTAGGKIRPTTAFGSTLPNLETLPLGSDIQVYGKYAESGTASSAGGPYYVMIYYTV